MAIFDRVKTVADAARAKLKETFGDPDPDGRVSNPDDISLAPPLDLDGAYSALGLGDTATLADVREAYRSRAKLWHPLAHRDGAESAAQRSLDHLLDALEMLEEHLVPLSGAPPSSKPSAPTRKRATARK